MSRLRLGLIGCGSVVREIYERLYYHSAYAELLSIEAVAEPGAATREAFCDRHGIPAERRFADYAAMLDAVELDAVAVNTPDSLHEAPAVAALERGLDALVPKPLADTIEAAHRMIEAAKAHGRLLGVDFHKRDDPRLLEAAARYAAGEYGEFQHADWHMVDRLHVVDPNHEPRFFASDDFAEKNTPISFLTVHMADSLMRVVPLRPVAVRATGWRWKLPSLRPVAVDGYDLCETEVRFENDGVARFVTGWHLPNTAPMVSMERTVTTCTDGRFELMHTCGYHDLVHDAARDHHVLFQHRTAGGDYAGFGMSVPGRWLQRFRDRRDGTLDHDADALLDPFTAGFWPTVIVEAAHESLRAGEVTPRNATFGETVRVPELLRRRLGPDAETYLA